MYAATYTIPWAFCINFFDADIVLVICAAIFMAFVLLFNIRRMLPDWKITILLYFLPAIASSFPYIGGTHQLYAWTPVKDPLKLQVWRSQVKKSDMNELENSKNIIVSICKLQHKFFSFFSEFIDLFIGSYIILDKLIDKLAYRFTLLVNKILLQSCKWIH